MWQRAVSGSGSGEVNYELITKSRNQSLQLKTENCMVSVNNVNPAGSRSIIQALVFEGTLIYGAGESYGTVSYDTTTKILTVTGTYSGITYYMSVFGDYTIIT